MENKQSKPRFETRYSSLYHAYAVYDNHATGESQIKTILFTHMRKKIEITYWWDTNEYPNLTSEQKDALENAAEDRITEMRQDGYREGELIYEDDEISVSGWWESTKKDDE